MSRPVYIGEAPVSNIQRAVSGSYVTVDGELFYKINNYDQMPPFFMSIVSDSDHWMFIWTNGALSAGRKNPDHALFPYYTDDKIQDDAHITGSKTILLVDSNNGRKLWEPFSSNYAGIYNIERNCYKNIYGNKLIFEEINHDLELSFRYAWLNSERFGFVRRSRLENIGSTAASIELLDGIQNLLCYGIGQRFQQEYSTLADAYKKCELDSETNLGIYALSSIPGDKAEPSECMLATTVWSAGVQPENVLVSSRQLPAFRQGISISTERDVRAARGAYFVHVNSRLDAGDGSTWFIVSDIEQDASAVASTIRRLCADAGIIDEIAADVQQGTANLVKLLGAADGLQKTADPLSTYRHLSNTLYNIMRGGVFKHGYTIDKPDFTKFLSECNQQVFSQAEHLIGELPEQFTRPELLAVAAKQDNRDFSKLCHEYLPLTFSRRHGDPSRPWNFFSIDIKDDKGNEVLNYQGNWRDIFQNWEALALSFPEYIEGMIVKFVNASTADGYNPYRLNRTGFEWEVIDPGDQWSYIGYWGDHQIIYLLRLLEISQRYHPGELESLLSAELFAYAEVPYRLKSYQRMLKDPYNTVSYNHELDAQIGERVKRSGTDGKFVHGADGRIYHVNLTEKLLVPILAKLSNFVPEAGIWMNTQRPEWNDANNALVGYGVSMVTLCYLRRHLDFCVSLFKSQGSKNVAVSEEVAELVKAICKVLEEHEALLERPISDIDRKTIVDLLGLAGSQYRSKIYTGFSGTKRTIETADLIGFFELAGQFFDHTIRANRREDNLYHAYNLLQFHDQQRLGVRYTYEMLEGQVAVLSSGFLSIQESLQLLDALRNSRLYREDQMSYVLYPDRQLARFVDKNIVPTEAVKNSAILQKLIVEGDTNIVSKDVDGAIHFNGTFRNANDLKDALEGISGNGTHVDAHEKARILGIYEGMFDHQSFTGRSGTFYKYEGLGSIYWHMVSKLLLAVQETYYYARAEGASESDLSSLISHYYAIRNGIGATKSPDLYGGFPTDPYSHTPGHAGVQQPGMTGQVKEDFISRFGELGVTIDDGTISFETGLLRENELLEKSADFSFINLSGNTEIIELEAGSLAFTLAQVPVVYHRSKDEHILITDGTGASTRLSGLSLGTEFSRSIFRRQGSVQRLDVYLDI